MNFLAALRKELLEQWRTYRLLMLGCSCWEWYWLSLGCYHR